MFLSLVYLLSLFLAQLPSFCIHLVLSKDAGKEKLKHFKAFHLLLFKEYKMNKHSSMQTLQIIFVTIKRLGTQKEEIFSIPKQFICLLAYTKSMTFNKICAIICTIQHGRKM